MTAKEVREKYFTRWHYDYIESNATKEQYIARIGKLANVANKRAKTIKTAVAKGRITEDKTALFRYNDAVDYFNKHVAYNATFISTGKKVYEKFTVRELKALEKRLLHYLEAKSSTARGAMEVEQKRVKTFEERYGIDISKLPNKIVDRLFSTMHYLNDKNYAKLGSDQITEMLTAAVNSNTREGLHEIFAAYEELYPNLKDQAEFRVAMVQVSQLSYRDKAFEFKAAHELYKKRKEQPKPKYIKQER